jgi:hypothetical protein
MDPGEIEPSALRGPHRAERDGVPRGFLRAERDGDPRRGGELRLPVCASEVTFSRCELDRILRLYGRKVAAGEWRDYTIDFLYDRAVFSVFRHSCEVPIYRIEKNPRLERRQGAYSVITATGHILRRDRELDRVLGALDHARLHLVAG